VTGFAQDSSSEQRSGTDLFMSGRVLVHGTDGRPVELWLADTQVVQVMEEGEAG
jgi:hypothetical protein